MQTKDRRPKTEDQKDNWSRADQPQKCTRYFFRSVFGLWSSVFGLVLLSGCVRRSLMIRTEPPGAFVYVNDHLKGETPVSYDFGWYGWHRVILRKDGYERLEDRKLLRAPPYLWIPLDLVMELLPFEIRDARTWSYALIPTQTLAEPIPPEPDATQSLQIPIDEARPAPSVSEPTEPSDAAR
jgi:hypothetical protein